MLVPTSAPRRTARHAVAWLGLAGAAALLVTVAVARSGGPAPTPVPQGNDPSPAGVVAATAPAVATVATTTGEGDAPAIWRDGPSGSGTGAVLLDTGSGTAMVEGRTDGLVLIDLSDGRETAAVSCAALGTTPAHDDELSATPPADPVVPLLRRGGTAAAVVRIGTGSGLCSGPAGLAVIAFDGDAATLMATVPTPRGVRAVAVHPDGDHLFVAADDLTDRRGTTDVFDVAELSAPELVRTIMMANGVASDDLAFSEDGSRLYAAAASHALVLDTTDPAAPTRLGTIADPLVRNYFSLDSWTVDDPLLGHRELFIVRSRIDGLACPMGMVHVYDITGELFWEPAMVIDVDVPDALTSMRADAPLVDCAEPVLRMQSASRTVTIGFGDGHLPALDRLQSAQDRVMSGVLPAGRFPYDTTEEFRASLPRCTLVAA